MVSLLRRKTTAGSRECFSTFKLDRLAPSSTLAKALAARKAMRGRIAVQSTSCEIHGRGVFYFVPQSRDFWSAHASSRRFGRADLLGRLVL